MTMPGLSRDTVERTLCRTAVARFSSSSEHAPPIARKTSPLSCSAVAASTPSCRATSVSRSAARALNMSW
jgi:hypothetical protein